MSTDEQLLGAIQFPTTSIAGGSFAAGPAPIRAAAMGEFLVRREMDKTDHISSRAASLFGVHTTNKLDILSYLSGRRTFSSHTASLVHSGRADKTCRMESIEIMVSISAGLAGRRATHTNRAMLLNFSKTMTPRRLCFLKSPPRESKAENIFRKVTVANELRPAGQPASRSVFDELPTSGFRSGAFEQRKVFLLAGRPAVRPVAAWPCLYTSGRLITLLNFSSAPLDKAFKHLKVAEEQVNDWSLCTSVAGLRLSERRQLHQGPPVCAELSGG